MRKSYQKELDIMMKDYKIRSLREKFSDGINALLNNGEDNSQENQDK